MTLNVTLAGQRAIEALMTDTCTITRDGTPVFDPATGLYTTPSTTIYSGKCRVRTRGRFLRDKATQAGDTDVILWPYIVSVPVSSAAVEVLDTVTVDTASDAALVGVKMRVRIASHATEATAHRLDCEEVA